MRRPRSRRACPTRTAAGSRPTTATRRASARCRRRRSRTPTRSSRGTTSPSCPTGLVPNWHFFDWQSITPARLGHQVLRPATAATRGALARDDWRGHASCRSPRRRGPRSRHGGDVGARRRGRRCKAAGQQPEPQLPSHLRRLPADAPTAARSRRSSTGGSSTIAWPQNEQEEPLATLLGLRQPGSARRCCAAGATSAHAADRITRPARRVRSTGHDGGQRWRSAGSSGGSGGKATDPRPKTARPTRAPFGRAALGATSCDDAAERLVDARAHVQPEPDVGRAPRLPGVAELRHAAAHHDHERRAHRGLGGQNGAGQRLSSPTGRRRATSFGVPDQLVTEATLGGSPCTSTARPSPTAATAYFAFDRVALSGDGLTLIGVAVGGLHMARVHPHEPHAAVLHDVLRESVRTTSPAP